MPRIKNLQELLLQSAARWSGNVAFRHILGTRVRELEYGHLAESSYRCAQSLWASGVRKGDYVLLWAANSPDWVITALAVFRLGAILVPCDATGNAQQVLATAKQIGRPIIVAGGKQYLAIADLLPAKQLARLSDLASLDASVDQSGQQAEQPHMYSSAGSDPAVLAFTAGAHGQSKGVLLTHEFLISRILAAEEAFGIDDDDKVISTLPFSNMLGMTAGLAVPFHTGATIVFGRISGPGDLKEILRLDGISVVVGTPQVFQSLLSELEHEAERLPRLQQLALALSRRIKQIGSDFAPAISLAKLVGRFQPQLRTTFAISSMMGLAQPVLMSHVLTKVRQVLGGNINFFISGDSPAPADLVSAVESFGIPYVNVYGLTEASYAVAVRRPFLDNANSVGRPVDGIVIKVDGTGDVPGEILVKGRGVVAGYWNDERSPESRFEDGWLRTGDNGYIDQDGQLCLAGAVRQPVTTPTGQDVDLTELEELLESRPVVLEACVFAREGKSGNEPCAAIVASTIARSKPDFIERITGEVDTALADLPEHKRLVDYQIWQTRLPRTATGKVRRGEVAAAYARKRKAKSAGVSGDADLVSDSESLAISGILAEVMDPEILKAINPSGSHVFGPNVRLVSDLGLDSLAHVQLACRLSQHLAADVSEEVIHDTQTVEDLIVLAKGIKKGAEAESSPQRRSHWSERAWPVEHYGTFEWPGLDDPFVVAARRTIGVLLKTTAKIFNELETAGADRLVIDPPYIVAANHVSRLDTVALMACFPVNLLRLVHPVEAADELFLQPLPAAAAAYLLNAISYERTGALKEILSKCEDLLNAGKILILYPEGSPSSSTDLRPFAPIAAHLAISTGCPIIPAFIDGTRDVLDADKTIPSPARVKITFGLPLYPPLPGSAPNAARELTRRLQLATESLRPSPVTARAANIS